MDRLERAKLNGAKRIGRETREEFARMYREGHRVSEIMRRFGVRRETVDRALAKAGLAERKSPATPFPALSGEELAKAVVSTYCAGRGLGWISKKTGKPREEIRRIILSQGVPCPAYELDERGDRSVEYRDEECDSSRRARARRARNEALYGEGYLVRGRTLEDLLPK